MAHGKLLLVLVIVLQSITAACGVCENTWDIQLSNNGYAGKVEICYNNNWYTVKVMYESYWGAEEASIVCRQLGLEVLDVDTTLDYISPSNSQNGLLLEVHCSGSEERLANCFIWNAYFSTSGYVTNAYCQPCQPAPFTNVNLVALNSTALRLSWTVSEYDTCLTPVLQYYAFCQIASQSNRGIYVNTSSSSTEATIYNALPNTSYTCCVQAETTQGLGWRISCANGETPLSVPLPPVFTFSRHTATAVQIIIDPQEGFHGVYNIFWIERRSLDCKLFTNAQSISGTQTSFTLLNLDPGQEYCVTVSAETSAGVGNHSTAIAVELYTNSPFRIQFTSPMTCGEVVKGISGAQRERLESVISDALSERCNCLFSQDYIANGQVICSDGPSGNTVVFQGRLIGTQDADSVELLLHLQEWLLTEPTISWGGVSLQAVENCRVYYKGRGNTTTPCEWPPRRYRKYQQSITGAAVGAGLLALLTATVLVAMVVMCFCQSPVARIVYKKTTKRRQDEVQMQSSQDTPSCLRVDGREEETVIDGSSNDHNSTKKKLCAQNREGKQQSNSSDDDKTKRSKSNDYDKTMAMSMTVDWNTHCLLQRLSEKSTGDEAGTAGTAVCDGEEGVYEEVKQDPEDCQAGEQIYQPLVPPRLLGVGEGGAELEEEASPYQDLTYDH